mgnify:CR=1 FL=1
MNAILLRTLVAAVLPTLATAQTSSTQTASARPATDRSAAHRPGTDLAAAARLPLAVDDLLPATTYAAFRFGGLAACRQATGDLPISELFRVFLGEVPAELRAEHVDTNLAEAADDVRLALQDAGLRPADVRALAGQPMAFGVGRLTIEGMGPSVALLVEEGNHADAIQRCFAALEAMLPRLGVEVEAETVEVAGHRLRRLASADGPPIFAGSIAGCFCVSNSRGYLRDVAGVAAGRQPGLAAATRFGHLRAQLPAAPLAAGLLHPGVLTEAFGPHLPYEAEDVSDALGVGGVDVVYAAATAGAHGGTDLLHVGVGGSERGLLKALVATPADLSFARACSANTIVFGAASFDAPAVLEAFGRFTALLPQEVRAEIDRELGRELGRELRRMGTSPAEVEALLRAFGGQLGFALALEKGAVPKPELLLHVAVQDRETVAALLQRVEAAAARAGGAEWRTREVDAHVVRFCNVAMPEAQLQLSPCYALTDDGLWIGSDVAGLVGALRRAADDEDGLTAEDDFRAMAAAVEGASGVLHVRSFRGVEIGWRTVETMLYPMLDAQSDHLGFDSDALPDSETLAAALGTTTFSYRVDDDGVTVRGEGTFALGALFAAVGALCDEVLDRATGKIY